MIRTNKLLIVLAIITNMFSLNGQNAPVDTFDIYKNKCGVDFNIYMHTWFFGYGLRNSYSYNPNKLNAQDSLVIESDKAAYFRVYDSSNMLVMEGETESSGLMVGDIKFYYKDGDLRRIEHWDRLSNDSSSTSISLHEAPGRCGNWRFYRKSGILKKQYTYRLRIISCEPMKYEFEKETLRYNLKGHIKSRTTKVLRLI